MPVAGEPNWGLIEWLTTAVWTILAAIVGGIGWVFKRLQARFKALEVEVGALKANSILVDHDLRGVRQSQAAQEAATKKMHEENKESDRRMMDLFERQMTRMGDRLDRLTELLAFGHQPQRLLPPPDRDNDT